jgi:hypothetical protein
MLMFLQDVFPLFQGFDAGRFFLKAVLLGGFFYLHQLVPVRYLWSLAFLLGLGVLDLAFSDSVGVDRLALLVRLYLSWMCAEVTFQSASAEPEERIHGWWALSVLFIVLL